jgi:hypothetical protein
VRLRPRPLLVALSFLSAVALGAIALGAVSALMRAAGAGVAALSLIGGSVCLGGAAAALAVTRTKRPGLSWFAGLVGAFLIALPMFFRTVPVPPLPALHAADPSSSIARDTVCAVSMSSVI